MAWGVVAPLGTVAPYCGGMTDWLTFREAAERFGVSVSTLHRRRRAGDLEQAGAHKGTDGQWRIPPHALALLGYRDTAPDTGAVAPSDTAPDTPHAASDTPDDTHPQTVGSGPSQALSEAQAEIRRLQDRLDLERQRADLLAANLEDVRTAMRMLTAGSSGAESETTAEDDGGSPVEDGADRPVSVQADPPARSWWRRMFGG